MDVDHLGGIGADLVGAAECAGDFGPIALPFARTLLSAPTTARVFEVDGPAAWRRLCLTYPTREGGGLVGGLAVTDFGAAARDWDAVHPSLVGLPTADQVRLDGPEGPTELQRWDAEATVRRRWGFDGATRLPDLQDPIPVPVELR